MLDFAVIGCGYWGPNLIRNLIALPECRSMTCCDTDAKKLASIKRLHPDARLTESTKEVIDNPQIDAVAIATPSATHYRFAKECLLAGKHVLVEKPLACSHEHCSSLTRLACENDRVLMVGHTYEYCAAVNKTKEVMRSGTLGDIRYLRLLRLNLGPFRPDVSVIWDLAAHDVSILLYLLEQEPIGVSAHGQSFVKEGIEDIVVATLYFDRKIVAVLNDSWLDPCKVRSMTIVGSHKMLVYNDNNVREKIKIYDKGIDAPSRYDDDSDFRFSCRYGDV